ncbi:MULTISPECIES: alpha/beta fold hydrolase [unclassified Roseitalea]|uniref:alpha/beta fold hydrolase n=1 Tax=unclassified Roseitalea TaxID=2639107 RepID=UPI00273FE420|nr:MULTISPECIES: alpha/beta fold hydrolase [unclassified Roseitalea]
MSLPLVHAGGDGPPALMIHGFGADALSWTPLVAPLAARHAVWTVDLPAHGRAGPLPADCAPADLAALVATALERFDAPVSLVGHSLGAAVALHVADQRPDRVGALVLIAPAGWGTGLDARFLRELPRVETDGQAQALLARLVARPGFITPAMARHVLAGLAAEGRRADLARLAEAMLAAPPPPAPRAGATVLWGTEDAINPRDPDRPLPEGVALHSIEGAGHMPHAEVAGRVGRLVAQALG